MESRARPLLNKIAPAQTTSTREHRARPPSYSQRGTDLSPPHRDYTTREVERTYANKRRRSPPQYWKEKAHPSTPTQRNENQPLHLSPTPQDAPQATRPPLERNLALNDYPQQQGVPSTEEVMNELREATYQYVNVADPVEAEARRQRVFRTNKEGLMETTAANIIATATRNLELARQETSPHSPLVSITHQEIDLQLNGNANNQESATPASVSRQRNRSGVPRRVAASPRIFAGTNLRRRNITSSQNRPGRQGFPHASPMLPPSTLLRE